MVYLPGDFSGFLKREVGLLNTDAERQFGSAAVYDSSEISLSRNRVPASRVRNDKITIQNENGQVGRSKRGELGRIGRNTWGD